MKNFFKNLGSIFAGSPALTAITLGVIFFFGVVFAISQFEGESDRAIAAVVGFAIWMVFIVTFVKSGNK